MRQSLLIRHCARYWKAYLSGSLILVLTNLLHVILPNLVGRAIDLVQGSFVPSELYTIAGLILGIELVKGACRFGMRYIMIGASWKIENDIRVSLFRHLLTLPIPYFDRTRTGDIIARATNDLTAVRMMSGPAFMYALNAVVLVPLAVGFMLANDPVLTLYALTPFPFIALGMYFIGRGIHLNFVKVQESYSDISAHVQENLNGIGIIKSFVRERREQQTLRDLSRKYVKNNISVIKLQSLLFPLLDVFASLGVIILLWTGGQRVIQGETTIGTVVALVMYIGLLVWPAMALGWVTALIQRGIASLRRIEAIFEEQPEPHIETGAQDRLTGHIRIEHLGFAFGPGQQVLHDITFEAEPGHTVAVVGRTGSGKSTLLGVLAGIYQAQRGSIFFDGTDVTELPLGVLRSSIAMVPQETFLFSDTIAENISFGKADADNDRIRNAARRASIDGEIDLFPHGYETMLGERGITVSGGQRQRIAIARALISDAPILLFDDSLSNVDTVTERSILEQINEAIAEKTAIIVTQRLGAVKNADLILYLTDGRITERGTHAELLSLDSEYAALFREQETLEALENPDLIP